MTVVEMVWVVEMVAPRAEAPQMTAAAAVSAAKPWMVRA